MTESVKIAILGLDEAGWLLANGLKNQGANVVGFDSVKPKFAPAPLAESAEAAVADADIVLALNPTMVSVRMAERVAGHLKPGALYAELNPGTPSVKRKLAAILPADSFVDGAILTPVSEMSNQIELEVAGVNAQKLSQLLAPFGLYVKVVSNQPGDASARFLLRSLMQKGITAVITDVLWAAKSMNLEEWAIQEVMGNLSSLTEADLQGQINEAGKNPKRHSVEMGSIVEMLAETGYESTMANGVSLTFSHLMHGRKIPFADLS